ncbi:hypothetical protein [Fluviicola chungangensis]|uniref:DUF695 domain-containing protein n=1 Tax=Fluviicola chungangensis TaxID=2597671 RepID=A0A556N7D8_9FLAO|nr:hypothetical protein [Fluviicola chungangensis]TSJ48094.1 hypothetical protein FO442_02875 [Fluviicola chungangensis]
MNLFGFFQRKKKKATNENITHMDENHLVVIQFFYGIEDLNELHELEKQLDSNIKDSELGKYEGHDISMDFGDGYLYFNGKNADQIFQSIKPILEQHYFMDKSVATLRFGSFENPAAEERDFLIRFSKLQEN